MLVAEWAWQTDDAKRLKGLKGLKPENEWFYRMVADQALDVDMLKEVNKGNFRA